MTGRSEDGRMRPPRPVTSVRARRPNAAAVQGLAAALVLLALSAVAWPFHAAVAEPLGRDSARIGEIDEPAPAAPAAIERAPLEPAVLDGWSARSEPAEAAREPVGAVAMRDAANRALSGGDVATAQRLFERIIAEDPVSPEAQDARRRLGAIYRGEIAVAPAKPEADMRPAALDTIKPAPAATPEPRSPDTAAAIRSGAPTPLSEPQPWRQRAQHSQRFEELLRVDVGDRIFFGLSSADIGSRARAVVERQARWLARYPDLYIVAEGHADEPGNDRDNDAIGRARAETARAMLIAAGVPADRIDIDTRGRRDRASTCEDAVCSAQNRRVVIRLMVVLPAPPGNRSSISGAEPHPTRFSGDADRQQAQVNAPPRR